MNLKGESGFGQEGEIRFSSERPDFERPAIKVPEVGSQTTREDRELQEQSDLALVRAHIENMSQRSAEALEPQLPINEEVTSEEQVVISGQTYTVQYVKKQYIAPAFGYGGGEKVQVREDLSPRVKGFVKAHELYHSTDKQSWGGWIGREIRANFYPGLKDPLGLLATIRATLTDKERMKLYIDRFRKGY